jgi:chromate transporter
VLLAPWLVTGLGAPATSGTLVSLFWYFAAAGTFVFGSGLAIVPFLHGGVVNEFHWLTERQFLDAVAVGMSTPGPVVITGAFIGFLVAGPLGAAVTAVGTFFPCWLLTVLFAPRYHRLASNARVKAFVDGVTAAATGAIVGAAVVLGRRALVDGVTVAVALASLAVVLGLKKVPDPVVVLAAALVGWATASA